eukprot:779775-Rhodomonas_salina.1
MQRMRRMRQMWENVRMQWMLQMRRRDAADAQLYAAHPPRGFGRAGYQAQEEQAIEESQLLLCPHSRPARRHLSEEEQADDDEDECVRLPI